jgi:hypothetical protein
MDAHVTDDRFDRELRRRELARRLVSHQARTHTIFEMTALTRHQLATLRQRWRVMQETRHRGPSPKSFAAFFSSAHARSEAAALTTLCRVLGAAPIERRPGERTKLPGLEIGERLCETFELYRACFPRSAFEFEHLVLLARGLAQGNAIAVGNCTSCQGTILIDLFATRRNVCSHCLQGAGNGSASRDEPVRSNDLGSAKDGEEFGIQRELF